MEKKYGDSGNSLRNKHMSRKGEFVMFADDDNWFVSDALDTVRAHVYHDRDALFVFQLEKTDGGSGPFSDSVFSVAFLSVSYQQKRP